MAVTLPSTDLVATHPCTFRSGRLATLAFKSDGGPILGVVLVHVLLTEMSRRWSILEVVFDFVACPMNIVVACLRCLDVVFTLCVEFVVSSFNDDFCGFALLGYWDDFMWLAFLR
ncbi:hypothetical protein C1H46_024876 [Malus baccata]|uniref:Uncharacterized protein n=1 Tax=Malus baccata TaxID=106549 RepID=A0A540LTF5_MALBA|nr:hypothetical protein C1H46_024875 [Malus baccata]TQD89579.1 hypothetical protein C1H46_024876 [Malus baccata]